MAFNCTIPAVPTVQRDDHDIRVTRWDFVPGAATGWHTHGWPYFIVMLTDAIMLLHNGTSIVESVFQAGQTYQRPAGVQHDVMNGSKSLMAFVEIEFKRPTAISFPLKA